MIIDAHAHIGHAEDMVPFQISSSMLIDIMDNSRERIDVALISHLCKGVYCDQSIVNQFTKKVVLQNPDRFRGLVWVNPCRAQTGLSNDVDDTKYCLSQLDNGGRFIFVGLKFHPFLNGYHFSEEAVGPFLRAAQEYKVPVAVHTAYDRFSKPENVADVARQFMDINFILYHAGLDPPDMQSGMKVLERVASQSNLYIDISWLEYERLERAVEVIPDRVMFGTDLPLGGQQHYVRYFDCLDRLGDAGRLNEEKRSKLLQENCQRVFSRLLNEDEKI